MGRKIGIFGNKIMIVRPTLIALSNNDFSKSVDDDDVSRLH